MQKTVYFIIGLGLVLGGVFYWLQNQESGDTAYNPVIDPGNFVSGINNKYFTLKPGTKFTYEKKTDEGLERIEVVVTNETREVMRVEVVVVRDRVWFNDVLLEDTKDWYAQDKEGNIWYFGEEVDNYEAGKFKDHAGAWEVGIDGALPGIIMLADPQVGDSYRQEYYKGEAEDMGEVLATDETVDVPYGTFKNCLKTYDRTPLNPGAKEHKYYCPEVGGLVLEKNLLDGERTELIDVQN